MAGSWTCLAMDFSEGIFYRPLFSEAIGFGGTRFFPLFFSLHALAIKLWGLPILSGHVVSLFSGALLFVSCFFLLNQLKVKPIFAIGLICLLSSELSVQHGFSTIRGDILPVALNVLGIVCYLSKMPSKYKIILAAACFVLAFSAKITAVSGILSLEIWLILTKKRKEALLLALAGAFGYIIVFCILYFGTSGRIIAIFKNCSSADADLHTLLRAPRAFVGYVKTLDKELMIFLCWALFLIIRNYRTILTNLFFIFLLVSGLITIIILGSPGTDTNHFVDIATASILLIGSLEFTPRSRSMAPSICVYSAVTILILLYNVSSFGDLIIHRNRTLADRYPTEIVNIVKQSDSKLLSENPMFPILADKRPYLLDSFMLRLIVKNNAAIKAVVMEKLEKKEYPVIILMHDPLERIERYYNAHFGADVIMQILSHYREIMRKGESVVYVPK